eukprot:6949526-Pyramimonas_sp.AAC.1
MRPASVPPSEETHWRQEAGKNLTAAQSALTRERVKLRKNLVRSKAFGILFKIATRDHGRRTYSSDCWVRLASRTAGRYRRSSAHGLPRSCQGCCSGSRRDGLLPRG